MNTPYRRALAAGILLGVGVSFVMLARPLHWDSSASGEGLAEDDVVERVNPAGEVSLLHSDQQESPGALDSPIRESTALEGISYWRNQQSRLEREGLFAWPAEDDVGWSDDEEVVEIFLLRLERLLDESEAQLVAPDAQHVEWFARGEEQAIARLELIQRSGQFSCLSEDLIYSMLPFQQFAFSKLVAEAASQTRLDEVEEIAELAGNVDPFALAPEDVLARFYPDAGGTALLEAGEVYRAKVLEYLAARGRYEEICKFARKAARAEGIAPPQPVWLPRVWPEAGELREEMAAYRAELWSFYASVGHYY